MCHFSTPKDNNLARLILIIQKETRRFKKYMLRDQNNEASLLDNDATHTDVEILRVKGGIVTLSHTP